MKIEWERNVIPKWRKSTVAATLPETHPSKNSTRPIVEPNVDKELLERELTEWRETKSIGLAADLLNQFHIDEAKPFLEEPASYILGLKSNLPSGLTDMANKVLGIQPNQENIVLTEIETKEKTYQEIAYLKQKLFINPRDAITLVDLARLYASLGQRDKADKAIETATAIYPNHRFILRSSVRYWIHNDKSEKGLYLLRKTERTRNDPWLLASEIAVESVLKRSPQNWKLANKILASNKFSSAHLTELASATASVHLLDGNIKDAKKLFNKALLDPNDNAIAQAIWASQHFGLQIRTRPEWFEGEFSAEANYYQRQAELDFNGAFDEAIKWFLSEPFSLRPLRAAAYAAAIMERYTESAHFAQLGLAIDKEDTELKNNLVYGLASQGKTEEALAILREIYFFERNKTGRTGYHTLANIAMLHYRLGYIDDGEKLYRACINMLSDKNHADSKGVAAVSFAKEAALANAPNSSELLLEAEQVVKSTASRGGLKLLELLTNKKIENTKVVQKHIPTWFHEAATNTLYLINVDPFKVK